jgi:DNA polymerase-3 subunit delta'
MKNSDHLFPQFAGNENALRQLSKDITAGRFPHALLLEGPAGCGKMTLAHLLAGAAVCNSLDKPCHTCAHCRKAAQNIHPDITEISVPEGKQVIPVNLIRELRQAAYVLPNEAAVKVVIVKEAHRMNAEAQNALLKILEEPPAHVLFILTCENRAMLLPTIRSRTQMITLTGVTWEQAKPLLLERFPEQDEQRLYHAFMISGGVIGTVIAGLQNDTMDKVLTLTPKIAEALIGVNEWDLIALTASLDKDKDAFAGVLGALQLIFRDALTLHYGGTVTLSTAPETAVRLSQTLSGERLLKALNELEYLKTAAGQYMNQNLLLTQFSARLRRALGR